MLGRETMCSLRRLITPTLLACACSGSALAQDAAPAASAAPAAPPASTAPATRPAPASTVAPPAPVDAHEVPPADAHEAPPIGGPSQPSDFCAFGFHDPDCGHVLSFDVMPAYQHQNPYLPGGPSVFRLGFELGYSKRLGRSPAWLGLAGELSATTNDVRTGAIVVPKLLAWAQAAPWLGLGLAPGFLWQEAGEKNSRQREESLGFSGQALVSFSNFAGLWAGVEWLRTEGRNDEVRGFIGARVSLIPVVVIVSKIWR